MVIDKSVEKTICYRCIHCFESRVGWHVFMFLMQMKGCYKKPRTLWIMTPSVVFHALLRWHKWLSTSRAPVCVWACGFVNNSNTLCSASLLSILCVRVHVCAHSITWLSWPSYCWSTTCGVFFKRHLKYFSCVISQMVQSKPKFHYSTIHDYNDKLLNSYNNLVTGHGCHCW